MPTTSLSATSEFALFVGGARGTRDPSHGRMICGINFAGPDAFGPCVIKVGVAGISAVLKPSTAVGATTNFTAVFVDTTLSARDGGGSTCSRGCICGHVSAYICVFSLL